ncbi:MAG: hypothetical protein ACRDCH_01765 [Metamycoplasmataceae bacterium]
MKEEIKKTLDQIDSHQIIIKENVDLSEKVKEFIGLLEKDYRRFLSVLKKEEEKWSKIIENDEYKKNVENVYFTPEKVLIKSPITIIDAPWGTGKTYFIEELGRMFIKGEIDSNLFQKFIIIDTWKFCNSNDVIMELMNELAQVFLTKDQSKDEKIRYDFLLSLGRKIKINLKAMVNSTNYQIGLSGMSVQFSKKDYEKEQKRIINDEEVEKRKKIQEEFDLILNHPPKTIIFFDNIERLGTYSMEMIKIIQKLSTINNLIIIFTLNKAKIHFTEVGNKDNYETNIDKYIQLPYYQIKQDYIGVLEKFQIDKKYIPVINEIMEKSIDGYNMSIRKLERVLMKNDIKKKVKNKYECLKEIKKIWNPNINEVSNDKLINKLVIGDIKEFLNFSIFLESWYGEIYSILQNSAFVREIEKLKYKQEDREKWNDWLQIINFTDKPHWFNWKEFNREWGEVFKKISLFLNDIFEYNKKKMKVENRKLLSIINNIKTKESEKKKLENKIKKCENIINELSNSNIPSDVEKRNLNIMNRGDFWNIFRKLDNEIIIFNKEKYNLEVEINKFQFFNNLMKVDEINKINSLIKNFEYEKNRFLKNTENNIIYNFYKLLYKKEDTNRKYMDYEEIINLVSSKIIDNS